MTVYKNNNALNSEINVKNIRLIALQLLAVSYYRTIGTQKQ